jgi:ABC-type Mn2+/Zn2+ transport system ATPase subunit
MAILKELRDTSRHLGRHFRQHQADTPILLAENIGFRYESAQALEDISFELRKGQRLAIVGPNGAGKSTLLNLIAGVQQPTNGSLAIYGDEPGGHICIAYIPQRSHIDWQFPVNVLDVVLMGRVGQLGLFRKPGGRDQQLALEALETVNLAAVAGRQISQLSGGQQQRMFIARAIAQQAELMLMDEPLTGLDANAQEDIFRILDELQERQVTVLVSLHDLKLASRYFELILLLNRRVIGFGTPDEVLMPTSLLAAYGGHLHLVPTADGLLALGDTCCEDEHKP